MTSRTCVSSPRCPGAGRRAGTVGYDDIATRPPPPRLIRAGVGRLDPTPLTTRGGRFSRVFARAALVASDFHPAVRPPRRHVSGCLGGGGTCGKTLIMGDLSSPSSVRVVFSRSLNSAVATTVQLRRSRITYIHYKYIYVCYDSYGYVYYKHLNVRIYAEYIIVIMSGSDSIIPARAARNPESLTRIWTPTSFWLIEKVESIFTFCGLTST